MKLTNLSPYRTETLRQIVVAAYAPFRRARGAAPWWDGLEVIVLSRKQKRPKVPKSTQYPPVKRIVLRVPRLTGNEWIPLVRQDHGAAPTPPTGVLTSASVAEVVQRVFAKWYGIHGKVDATVWSAFVLDVRNLPEVVPLQVLPATPAPGNVRRERYARVLELEREWLRALKLAETKVKFYQRRRRYYEKTLTPEAP